MFHSCYSLPLDPALNGTIEERVTLLELQVDDLTGDLDALEGEITIISSDQISQDQRILELEVDSDGKFLSRCI